MTLEQIKEKYPLNATFIGWYENSGDFLADSLEDVLDIDRWEFPPLDWGNGVLPFVVYDVDRDVFDCWEFNYFPVSGYLNTTGLPYDFNVVTFAEDFGWNMPDPEDIILVPDEELAQHYGWNNCYDYEWRVEQAAAEWNHELYEQGYILTSYDAVKNFVANGKKPVKK